MYYLQNLERPLGPASRISETNLFGRFAFLTQIGLTHKNTPPHYTASQCPTSCVKHIQRKNGGKINLLRTLKRVKKFVKWSEVDSKILVLLKQIITKAFRTVLFTPKT